MACRLGTVATKDGRRAKQVWTRLIVKVYEADPLEYPKCKGPMRLIALINDPMVVCEILVHFGPARVPTGPGPMAFIR